MTRIAFMLLIPFLAGCLGAAECTDCTEPSTEAPPATDTGNTTAPQPPEVPRTDTTATPGPPVPGGPFDLDAAGCDELLALIPIDAAVARQHVPAAYTPLLDPSGHATALVNIKECASLKIDGVDQGPGTGADIGVLLDEGDPGVFHYYQVHWMTSDPTLAARLADMGWQVANSTDHLTASDPGITAATAGTFGTMDLAAPVIIDGPGNVNEAIGYHDGVHGTVTMTKHVDGAVFGSGPATVEATGAIGGLLGPGGDGLAIHLAYDLDGRVDHADRPGE